MVSPEAAIRYPMESDDWIKTVLIGGVLTLFSFLLVPLILVYGYLVRVIQARLADNQEPPAFGEWGSLFVDGLKVFVIGIVYMLVPLIVWGLTVGGSIVAIATGSRGGAAAGIAGLLGGLVITFVLSLVFGYVAVAGIVNFARQDRIGAAFDVASIKQVALNGEYAIAWLVSVGVFIAASVVTGVLNVIPFVGFIVGSFVLFYAEIVAAHLWAGGYTSALGQPSEPTSPPPEESAV